MTNPSNHRAPREVPSEEVGPLGLGAAPAKDPLKQFGGMVVASSLTMELITFVLTLPLLYKLYDGTLWSPFNYGVVIGFMVVLLAAFAFMNKPWVVPALIVVHLIGVVLGFMIHWSIAFIFILFTLLWALAAYMRSTLVARMQRGYLTTQHLNQGS